MPVVGWALVVGLASVTPPQVLAGTPDGGGHLLVPVPHLDLFLHLFGYAILAALLVRTWPVGQVSSSRITPVEPVVFAVLATATFGLCIEGVQALLAYRTASLLDASINLLGSILGAGLGASLSRTASNESTRGEH